MKIYQFQYSLDEFIDGRMDEETQLFSTLDNAFKYCELAYGIKKKDFRYLESDDRKIYFYNKSESKWEDKNWVITEVILDEGLNIFEKKATDYKEKEG